MGKLSGQSSHGLWTQHIANKRNISNIHCLHKLFSVGWIGIDTQKK